MAVKHTTRIDRWLWTVRIYKTRSKAREACIGGKVKIAGIIVKPSRKIVLNDIIQVRKGMIRYLYKVRKIAEKRMTAISVVDFLQDITSEAEVMKLKSVRKQVVPTREKGQGRPTKKERRLMDKWKK